MHSRTHITVWLFLLVVGWAGGNALADQDTDPQQPQVDHMSLASLMYQDGHYHRAAAELAQVDTTAEDLDLQRYWLLSGLIHLKLMNYANARDAFLKSIEQMEAREDDQRDPTIYAFLAQAHYGNEEWEKAIQAIDKGGEAITSIAGVYLIRAQCHWRMGDLHQAWRDLTAGIARHPEEMELRRHRVVLMVELGLFQQATAEGATYLNRDDVEKEDYLLISEALIKGGETGRAIQILELANLRYRGDVEILIQLGRAYLQNEMLLSAARLFERAAMLKPNLKLDAAELYKLSGRPLQALHLNEGVADQKAKMRQRLGLLIELSRYEEAIAVERRLSRLGLLEQDPVTYALAYAFFQIGKYDRAERYLKTIRDPEIFAKSVELLRAITKCRANVWECAGQRY